MGLTHFSTSHLSPFPPLLATINLELDFIHNRVHISYNHIRVTIVYI